MKVAVENKTPNARSIKSDRKRSFGELPESELRRIKAALAHPAVEEPGGILAGASFTFPS